MFSMYIQSGKQKPADLDPHYLLNWKIQVAHFTGLHLYYINRHKFIENFRQMKCNSLSIYYKGIPTKQQTKHRLDIRSIQQKNDMTNDKKK